MKFNLRSSTHTQRKAVIAQGRKVHGKRVNVTPFGDKQAADVKASLNELCSKDPCLTGLN